MNHLPETGYLRLTQIIGNKKSKPPLPPIIPVGKSTWWEGVRSGRYPKPVKLGPRIVIKGSVSLIFNQGVSVIDIDQIN